MMRIKRIILLLGCIFIPFMLSACEKNMGDATDGADYSSRLFDNSYVHVINVEIAEDDWTDLCSKPTSKTKYSVNVTIDGETIEKVSFATKGNTSLLDVADSADSDRYSFKLNFGKYVEGQTYHGLDKLNLNNIYADATYMKDYISYEIFRAAGVEAPLASYVQLCINGEEFGLYIALEEVGESYLARNDKTGELYKPETEMLGNMVDEMPEGEMLLIPDDGVLMTPTDGVPQMPNVEMPQMPDDDVLLIPIGEAPQMPNGEMVVMEDFSKGAALTYIDGEISSYSDIFDNAQTDVTDEDKLRVIEALKQLSEGNVENYIDTEGVIRYFVAHNFVMNYDSYTGDMLHNYYLYEQDGKLSVLPWDYNLAFGGFCGVNMEGVTDIVNCGIDSPLSDIPNSERPMWGFIAENEEYLNLYHDIFDKLIADYFESGEFEAEISRVYEMLRPYVENDKSAFYTVEEFDEAYNNLVSFCRLRAESIRKQLAGSLSTITSEQKKEDKVDASEVSIDAMGTQGVLSGFSKYN